MAPSDTNFMFNRPGRMAGVFTDPEEGKQAFIAFVSEDPGSVDVPEVIAAISGTPDLYFDTVRHEHRDHGRLRARVRTRDP